MPAGAKDLKSGALIDNVMLVNAETGLTDYVSKDKVKKFWDNLADDDKQEMINWTYEQFIERVSKAYCYYLKRNNNIAAIGGTYPETSQICLWLLVSKDVYKYPVSLIKAVRKAIKKDLKIYNDIFETVLALPDDTAKTHHRFIEKVLGMEFTGRYFETKRVYKIDRKELLKCVNQQV